MAESEDQNFRRYLDLLRAPYESARTLSYKEREAWLTKYHAKLPHRLYHYRGISGDYDRLNLAAILVDSQFYLRSKTMFEDRNDCGFRLGRLAPRAEVRDYLVKVAKENGATAADIAKLQQNVMSLTRQGIRAIVEHDTKARFAAVGIVCFTASLRNDALWTRYAENHKGVCIEIDTVYGAMTFGPSKSVEYDDHIFKLAYPDTDPYAITTPIFRKQLRWKHEEEIRIAIPSGAGKYLDFAPESVVAVTLGSKATTNTREAIDNLLAKRKARGLPDVAIRTSS